jgi:ABC-type transport system involved in cytochrome bd biosynthesis fused ATPase/permease subunit
MKLIIQAIKLFFYIIAIYLANIILALILCLGLIVMAVLMPRVHTQSVKKIMQSVESNDR